ncbi:RNA polymerase sigma factor [Sorangium sp. So ce1097]|uniref:RNA polymerase sigma factor n=1 Tax=Sorangium sp. So ce1097 TaxID=3133330 RepID=UPI003F611CD0
MVASAPVHGELDVERLYRAHGHHVLRRARALLGSEEESRDVLQEVFLSLVQSPGQFEHRSSPATWLYSATTHRCLNRIRDRKNRARLLGSGTPPSDVDAPRAEQTVQAARLLAELPDELAQAAIYHYIDESTHEEIAAIMGCSRRHVGDLLTRVKRWAEALEAPAATVERPA